MGKHTPETWLIEMNAPTAAIAGHILKVAQEPYLPIGIICKGQTAKSVKEQEQRAHLAAAAPELLDLITRWRAEVLGGDHPESLHGWAREFVQEAGDLIRKTTTP